MVRAGRTRGVCALVLLASALVWPTRDGWSQARGRAAPAAPKSIAVPVERAAGVFFARVTLNGKGPFWFTVDTGATHTVIDPSTAERLGLEVAEEGGSLSVGTGPGTTPIATTRGVTVGVGTAPPFAPSRLFVVAVSDAAQIFRHAIDGVLGHDFLSQFVVEFDYRAGRLVLHDAVRFRYLGAGAAASLRIWRGRPLVPIRATLADDTAFDTEMLLDTGSSARSSFNSPLVEKYRLQRFPSLGMTASLGVNGVTAASVIRLHSIAFGTVTFEQPEIAIPTGRAGVGADSSFGGILTADLLGGGRLFVDYPARRLVLER